MCAAIVERREGRDLVGPPERLVEVADALHEPHPRGVLPAVGLRGEEHRPRRARPGEQREALHRPVVDGEAELRGGDPEARGRRGDTQVARDRELRAGAEGGPVARGDDRSGIVAQRAEHASQQVGEAGILHAGEVRPGAEVATRAREHEDTGSRAAHVRVEQLLERLVVERVATLLAVDRDEGDRAAVREVDHAGALYRDSVASKGGAWSFAGSGS